MTDKEILSEYNKARKDPIYFIEKYCMLGGKPIVLTESQKKMVLKHQEYLKKKEKYGYKNK